MRKKNKNILCIKKNFDEAFYKNNFGTNYKLEFLPITFIKESSKYQIKEKYYFIVVDDFTYIKEIKEKTTITVFLIISSYKKMINNNYKCNYLISNKKIYNYSPCLEKLIMFKNELSWSFCTIISSSFKKINKLIMSLEESVINKTTSESKTIFKIKIVARELLNNAVIHGNTYIENNKIIFGFLYTKTKNMYIIVKDKGNKINLPVNKEKSPLRTKQRGYFIIKKYTKEIKIYNNIIVVQILK